MNLLKKIRTERSRTKKEKRSLEKSVIDSVVRFADQIKSPEPAGELTIRLVEHLEGGKSGRKKMEAPYYLQFFSENTREGCLNAGYAAGQTAAYMRFRGISAVILRTIPEWMAHRTEDGAECRVVLAFGGKEVLGHRENDWKERSCVHVDSKEHWSEEILEFIKKQGLIGTEFTHVVFREECLHFLFKTTARKNPDQAAVDAGILIANIMAAAEELWIDLDFVKKSEITETGYLLSVCRREDKWKKENSGEPMVLYA